MWHWRSVTTDQEASEGRVKLKYMCIWGHRRHAYEAFMVLGFDVTTPSQGSLRVHCFFQWYSSRTSEPSSSGCYDIDMKVRNIAYTCRLSTVNDSLLLHDFACFVFACAHRTRTIDFRGMQLNNQTVILISSLFLFV